MNDFLFMLQYFKAKINVLPRTKKLCAKKLKGNKKITNPSFKVITLFSKNGILNLLIERKIPKAHNYSVNRT